LGQLGDGTRTGHSAPERVAGVPVYIAGVSAGDGWRQLRCLMA